MYLTSPKIVKFPVEHLVIKQVACGDAHSIALTLSLLILLIDLFISWTSLWMGLHKLWIAWTWYNQ